MKILRVHNSYQHRGGEDSVFEAEVDLLRSHGHEVRVLVVSNDDIAAKVSIVDRAQLALGTIWSQPGRAVVEDAIQGFRPEVVHFDNTFPLISPAAYSSVRKSGAAVVQTLHNFRLLCVNALFFRDGQPCEDCLRHFLPTPGVIHGCYRESHAQSAVVASMLVLHRLRKTWSRDVDRFIALSSFSRNKFVKGGLAESQVVVKPNFVKGPPKRPQGSQGSEFITVGRLSGEKGVATLLEAWTRHTDLPPLRLVGDGPMMSLAERAAMRNQSVLIKGRLSHECVESLLSSSYALVFPSECYENFPVTIAEAYAYGLPVIASRIGAMAELVSEGVTGLLFSPGDPDDLAAKVRWAASNRQRMVEMGMQARREYEQKYTPEVNYRMLMNIYADAIEHSFDIRKGA